MTIRSFTRAAYVALGIDAPWTPPFALENRGPRDKGGSGKYYADRGTRILGIVVHITAGINDYDGDDKSAENTTIWGSTTATDASWTACIDSDSIINCLHPLRVAWVQGVPGYNFNRPLVGFEIGKRDTDWRIAPQAWVDATLRNLAAAAAPYVIQYGIPLRVVTNRDEVQRLINAGQPVGFTEHWRLTPSTRSDAGRVGPITTFPWDRFFMFLREAIAVLKGGTPAPAPTPPSTPRTVVKGTVLEVYNCTRLNTRSGPGTNHGIVGGADAGVRVKATGKVSGAWIEAATKWQRDRGVASWWHTGYLKVVSQPKPSSGLPKGGVHVVKAGDTVGGLATRYKTSVRAIVALNGLANANRIEVGQRLYVAWVVGRGDTLGGIAERMGTSLSAIVKANPHITNPDRIEVGDLVRIP